MAIRLTEIDTAQLYSAIVRAVEVASAEPLYPGDERRIFAEALVAVVAGLQNYGNAMANAKTLQGAHGLYLDALGERTGTERIAAVAAKAVLRFALSEAQASPVTIPAGTLVTTDGTVTFATDGDLTIPVGELFGDAPATCTDPGEAGNGYGAGAVGQMVSIIPGVQGAENLVETTGGADEEEDDDYRERIRLANAAFSTAGPRKAYEYWAYSADPSVTDVRVETPEACFIDIYILCKGGELPGEDALRKVEEACSADDRRPLCDVVRAKRPETVPYDIDITYYTTADEEEACAASIEGEGGAIERFEAWQCDKMGRDVSPDRLRALCLSPEGGTGCIRIDVRSPERTVVPDTGVAVLGTVSVRRVVEGT